MKKKDRDGFIIFVSMILVLTGYYIYGKLMYTEFRYSIAVVTDIKNFKTGCGICFVYKYNDLEYDNMNKIGCHGRYKINKRYFVKIAIKNPRISDIMYKYPVPDSIKNAPFEGWEKLPISSIVQE